MTFWTQLTTTCMVGDQQMADYVVTGEKDPFHHNLMLNRSYIALIE